MKRFEINKGAKVFAITFVVYFLMLSVSSGEDISTIIFTSSYGSFVVASVVYAVYKLGSYIKRLIKT